MMISIALSIPFSITKDFFVITPLVYMNKAKNNGLLNESF